MLAVMVSGADGQTVLKTVVIVLAVVDFPVVPKRHIHMVLLVRKTIETPELQYVAWWSTPLLCRSCLAFRREVQKTVVMPQLHFFAVVDVLVVPQRHIHMVLPVWKTMEAPQLQYVAWCRLWRFHSAVHRLGCPVY